MLLRTFITGILLAAGAFAQMTSFPKPTYFRETFTKTQPKVELKDPVRLKDFVVGDKLELSLKNYLALVMANNTDIQIQMLTSGDAQERHPARVRRLGSRARGAVQQHAGDYAVHQRPGWRATELKTLSQPLTMIVHADRCPTAPITRCACGAEDKTTSNSTFNHYNPALASNLSVTFSQPLLQNRGSYVNRLSLMTARSRLRIASSTCASSC